MFQTLKQDIKMVSDTAANTTTRQDKYGLHELTVKDLRSELNERGIAHSRTLRKQQSYYREC